MPNIGAPELIIILVIALLILGPGKLPEVGASNKRGFIYQQPYFWAVDKHQDVTLTGDVETSARIGAAALYRYAPNRDTTGHIELAYYNEKNLGEARNCFMRARRSEKTRGAAENWLQQIDYDIRRGQTSGTS